MQKTSFFSRKYLGLFGLLMIFFLVVGLSLNMEGKIFEIQDSSARNCNPESQLNSSFINPFSINLSPNSAQEEMFVLESKWDKPIGVKSVAETYGLSGNDITIGFIDTGINLNHECFERFNNWVPYYQIDDTTSYGNPAVIEDVEGHGTHVISMAVGNSLVYQGVAPNASIVVVNIFNNTDNARTSPDRLRLGLEWLLNYSMFYPLDIISISVGAFPLNSTLLSLDPLIEACIEKNIVVVVSAGNAGLLGSGYVYSPGTSPYAITVGAISANVSQIYKKTGEGPTSFGFLKPDLVAPGIQEIGADRDNITGYKSLTGTSQATPIVAGIVALLLEFCQKMDVSITWKEIKWLLSMSAINSGDFLNEETMQHNDLTGWGLIQLETAIEFLSIYANISLENIDGNIYSVSQSFPLSLSTIENSSSAICWKINITEKGYYKFMLDSSYLDDQICGLFDSTSTIYGEPVLLSWSDSPETDNTNSFQNYHSFISRITESGIYYLIVKTNWNTSHIEIFSLSLEINYYNFITISFWVNFSLILIFASVICVINKKRNHQNF